MADGADKVIVYDPPGAIGLPPGEAVVLFRFDEADTVVAPKDAAGTLDDPGPFVFSADNIPTVVDGVCGRARLFSPPTAQGYLTRDLPGRSSLLTRDLTIQVIVAPDIVAQNAQATPGAIICRGNGGAGINVAEFQAYSLELVAVSVPTRTYSLRWHWQTTAGVEKTQAGAQFTLPAGAFTMLTATRRWVSPTEVLLRYYIGDLMIGEVASSDGSIGGATTGTMEIGFGQRSATTNHFAGKIDELLILDHEITREEIEATWLRITRYQPLGQQLLTEMHDKGFPLPTDPSSLVERDLRLTGQALGYAAAQAENVRANILPQRAYGSTLDDWEKVVRPTPRPGRDVDTRRARVLAKLRQRRGCSIPGVEDALEGLLGGGSIEDLEFVAFSNHIRDSFTTIDPLRWDTAPSTASITVAFGMAKFAPGAGTFLVDDGTWIRMRQTVGGDGRQAHALVKLVFTTPQSTAEAGLYFENASTGDRLLLGLRDVGGSFRIYTQQVLAGVVQANVELATIGANPAAIWLHLYQTGVNGTWKAAWSTTSATAGYTLSADITHPTTAHWSGLYLRSISALGAGPRADFDDHVLYMPFSYRPFKAYVLLDRALGFTPDIDGANSVISSIRHAYTHAAFITNPVLLAGDPDGGAGVAPTGGY